MKSYLLLRATLSQSRSKFREYFPAVFLVCAIAYCAYFFLENTSRSLLQPVPPAYSILLEPPPALFISNPLVRMLVRVFFLFAEYFVCWLAFVVSLAAISGEMLNKRKDPAQVRLSAAFQRLWSARWGALVVLSFFAAGITSLFYEFVRPIFFRLLLPISHYSRLSMEFAFTAAKIVDIVSMILICVMLAKMALGVAELVDDRDIPPGKAMSNSLVATLGWEWLFAVLFSAMAAAGFAIDQVLNNVFHISPQYQQLNVIGREVIRGALRTVFASLGLMVATIMFANLYLVLRYGAETASPEEPDYSYSDN